MNDMQKNNIGWFLVVLLIISHVAINNVIFLRINKHESENNAKEITDNFKALLNNNQSRLEKKIFDFKKSLYISHNQTGDCDLRFKNLAKLLLSVIKMKNSLLQEIKFDNQITTIKPLVSDLNDQDIENAVNKLEGIKEINTIYDLKSSFEEAVDATHYNNSTLFKKITSNWIKIKNKNDPLKVKWIKIEDAINSHDWHSIDTIVSTLTHSEFKPWINKLNNSILAYKNISVIYDSLLQYTS